MHPVCLCLHRERMDRAVNQELVSRPAFSTFLRPASLKASLSRARPSHVHTQTVPAEFISLSNAPRQRANVKVAGRCACANLSCRYAKGGTLLTLYPPMPRLFRSRLRGPVVYDNNRVVTVRNFRSLAVPESSRGRLNLWVDFAA